MNMYFFDKRIYKVDDVEKMTEKQAAAEFVIDYIGAVLCYTDMNDFATDFNDGCINPGDFFVKIYN